MTTFDPNTLSISFLLCITITFTLTQAATFDIRNNCSFRLWAVVDPGGSMQLDNGENWTFNMNRGSVKGRAKIWAQTNCNSNGNGGCQNYTLPPFTLAEYSVNHLNNSDFFDISLVKGFNVPMEFSSTSDGCSKGIKCVGDINEQCPQELLDPAGCNNACTVFENDQYCCRSTKCEPTIYSEFFKGLCPDAYSNPFDDATRTFTCPNGTNYRVVFCPTNAATFDIRNNCPYTLWAAAVPGGGKRLKVGETWIFPVNPSTKQGRIWARTKCIFDESGRGQCETGDCGGLLQCNAFGQPPNTLAEYALNQFNNLDFFDISLVDGFNVPMEFGPTSNGCTRGIKCTADINGQCPDTLKASGGCNNPCTVFKTDNYCCNSGSCEPTEYSKFFKARCPDAYSYPKDDQTSTFTCTGGTNYKVVFCP